MSPQETSRPLAAMLYDWLQLLLAVASAIVLVFTFLGRVTPVLGVSMEPTLYTGDMMLVWSLGYTLKPGDVVVLTKQFDAAEGPIVKRVVAVEGQQVDIDYGTGTVYVDGAALDEPYLSEPMEPPWYGGITSITVPEGSIFVLGDNRNHSNDSRDATLGPVDTRYVLGRALLVFFPFGHVRAL